VIYQAFRLWITSIAENMPFNPKNDKTNNNKITAALPRQSSCLFNYFYFVFALIILAFPAVFCFSFLLN